MGAPRVFYQQRDLSQVVQGTEGLNGGVAGNAQWGPSDEIVTLDELSKFVQVFGKPVSPVETPMFYQALGWFTLARTCHFVRPQGLSLFGGIEALKDTEAAGITAGLSSLPLVPSAANVVGIYAKYAGTHPTGAIYTNISNVDDTTGTFRVQAGIALLTGGTELDTGDDWYEDHLVSVIAGSKADDGRSLYIEEVLARDSQLITGVSKASALIDDVPADSTSLVALANQTYVAATDSEISLAYDLLASVDAVDVDILYPGNFTDDVLNKIATVAIQRGDCEYIISPPITETWTANDISGPTGWLSNITGRNWEGSAFANYYTVKDEYNDISVKVPVAGAVAGATAYSASLAYRWAAPAGTTRGVQNNVDINVFWTQSDKNTLYDNMVNYIEKSSTYGVTIQGQRTLYAKNSALNRRNVAGLILTVKNDVMKFLQDFLYEYNNSRNRSIIQTQADAYMRDIQSKEGVYDYRAICDETNNTPTVIDNNQLILDLYLKPTKVAEFIYLRTTITATGIDFDKVIVQA